MRLEIFQCDRCGRRIEGGYQLTGPLKRIDGNKLSVMVDRAGDFCASCVVGVLVSSKMENSRPDIPIMEDEEISLDEAIQDRANQSQAHAPRPDQTPPTIPPATTISKRKREGLL